MFAYKLLLNSRFLAFIGGISCGGDYSALFQQSFFELISRGPKFQNAKNTEAQTGPFPPNCKSLNIVVGFNEIAKSCMYSCRPGVEKHFFIETVDDQETEYCCCGDIWS
jgi:hypothetical protein